MLDEMYNVAFPIWMCNLIVIPSSVIGKLICFNWPLPRVSDIVLLSATEGDAIKKNNR